MSMGKPVTQKGCLKAVACFITCCFAEMITSVLMTIFWIHPGKEDGAFITLSIVSIIEFILIWLMFYKVKSIPSDKESEFQSATVPQAVHYWLDTYDKPIVLTLNIFKYISFVCIAGLLVFMHKELELKNNSPVIWLFYMVPVFSLDPEALEVA